VKEKTVQIDKFAGKRNTTDSERLRATDLLDGVNVDLDATGKVSRRMGVTRRATGDASSLWSDGVRGYYMDAGVLKTFTPPSTTATVRSGLSTALRMSFAEMNGTVYYSNNQVTGRIVGSVDKPWGIPVPPAAALAATGGDMAAGTYGVTVVYRRSDGQISGAPRAQFITVGANAGVTVSGISASADPEVTLKEIYFTPTNGEAFYRVATIANATTTYTRTNNVPGTVELITSLKEPPPPGHLLCKYNGRIFVASGAYLFHSEPFWPELFDLRKNYLPFIEEPTILAPVDGGIYVATRGKTVFLRGDSPESFVPVDVAPYGAPLGNYVEADASMVLGEDAQLAGTLVGWMSSTGFVVGDSTGKLVNLTQRRYTPAEAQRTASVFKQRGGLTQFISVLFR
jgi:hypothetical protein